MDTLDELFKWLNKTRAGNGVVIKANNELAALRAERDKAVDDIKEADRVIRETYEWLIKNNMQHTAHGRQLSEYLAKVQS